MPLSQARIQGQLEPYSVSLQHAADALWGKDWRRDTDSDARRRRSPTTAPADAASND